MRMCVRSYLLWISSEFYYDARETLDASNNKLHILENTIIWIKEMSCFKYYWFFVRLSLMLRFYFKI